MKMLTGSEFKNLSFERHSFRSTGPLVSAALQSTFSKPCEFNPVTLYLLWVSNVWTVRQRSESQNKRRKTWLQWHSDGIEGHYLRIIHRHQTSLLYPFCNRCMFHRGVPSAGSVHSMSAHNSSRGLQIFCSECRSACGSLRCLRADTVSRNHRKPKNIGPRERTCTCPRKKKEDDAFVENLRHCTAALCAENFLRLFQDKFLVQSYHSRVLPYVGAKWALRARVSCVPGDWHSKKSVRNWMDSTGRHRSLEAFRVSSLSVLQHYQMKKILVKSLRRERPACRQCRLLFRKIRFCSWKNVHVARIPLLPSVGTITKIVCSDCLYFLLLWDKIQCTMCIYLCVRIVQLLLASL